MLTSSAIVKLLLVFALSSIKFMLAPPLSLGFGFTYFETLASTTLGGIFGVVLFFYFSKWIIALYNKYFFKIISDYTHTLAEKLRLKSIACWLFPKRKRIFTFKNRLTVKVKRNFGLIGIVVLTPVLLSIPLGAFLAARYFSKMKYVVWYLSASVLVWSALLSTVSILF